MDAYEHILDSVRRRKPIPATVASEALGERMALEGTDQRKREVHTIVEAVRTTGAVVHNVDELDALGMNLQHASYYAAPEF